MTLYFFIPMRFLFFGWKLFSENYLSFFLLVDFLANKAVLLFEIVFLGVALISDGFLTASLRLFISFWILTSSGSRTGSKSLEIALTQLWSTIVLIPADEFTKKVQGRITINTSIVRIFKRPVNSLFLLPITRKFSAIVMQPRNSTIQLIKLTLMLI